MVVKEYLRFFEFEKLSLLESLRQFLSCFSLTGESQERERIMVHFSDRYFECNPQVFKSVGELEREREREGEREGDELCLPAYIMDINFVVSVFLGRRCSWDDCSTSASQH